MDDLPVQPGTYALFLRFVDPCTINIGKLGKIRLSAGIYTYQGSARGPGGLRARLRRHLLGSGKIHWHIDYLREQSEVLGYAFITGDANWSGSVPTECCWSQLLGCLPGISVPIPGLGASDCKSGCRSHLVYISEERSLEDQLKDRIRLILKTYIVLVNTAL